MLMGTVVVFVTNLALAATHIIIIIIIILLNEGSPGSYFGPSYPGSFH